MADKIEEECKRHEDCIECKYMDICQLYNPVIKVGNTMQVAEDIRKIMKRSLGNGIFNDKGRNGNS